jgi:PD-(D/E)XK nuclease superfamily
MILSYTLLNTWAICPHQAARRYIIKDIPFEATPAMEEGRRAHEDIAKFIAGGPDPQTYADLVRPLVGKCKPERKLAIEGDALTPVSFYDRDAWLRGVIDAHVIEGETAVIFDWKTGKEREDPFELEVFGLLLRAHHPELQKIYGYYVWLRSNKVGEQHDVSDYARTWAKVMNFSAEIEKGDYKKTPGPLCAWCPVVDCEHNRRGK